MKLIAILLMQFLVMAPAMAASKPYNENADAKADISHALSQARNGNKKVLVIFGANWCPDCQALAKALQGKSGDLLQKNFIIVKIDVGDFDKNLDVANEYGDPIKKGIPAAVVLTPENKVLYSTKAGELANARNMGDNGIYTFFKSKLIDTD